ncbi:ATP-binding protein [Haloarcula salina]|uniref:ATP-binding protein n=1 Tax=Haloarcula salina TaxID=1429914 RepID=UPI003C6F0D0A
MTTKRLLGCGSIAATGVGVGLVAGRHLVAGGNGLVGTAVAAFGVLVGLGFLAGSAVLFRSDVRTEHALRVAGWNLLGVVVTAAVLALILRYQRANGGTVVAPLFSGTIVVGVSATAHVLIGVNDVRRIRTRNLARQREKASVMNRLIRHDLKHSAQVLIGLGDALTGRSDPTVDDIGERVNGVGSDLAAIDSQVETVTRLIEADAIERDPVDLASVTRAAVEDLQSDFPDAAVAVTTEDDGRALAGEPIEIAVSELIENALEHGGDPTGVEVHIERAGRSVTVAIRDDGPGIPADERALVTGEQEVTQLKHSNGLGLWLSKWVVEAYDGSLEFTEPEDGGATVTIRLDAAN